MTTGDFLKLREALVPIIQTNLIFVEQNDPKIFTVSIEGCAKTSKLTNSIISLPRKSLKKYYNSVADRRMTEEGAASQSAISP